MKLTGSKVTSCYDLMDAAYDATQIWEQSRELGHVPIIEQATRQAASKRMRRPHWHLGRIDMILPRVIRQMMKLAAKAQSTATVNSRASISR